MDRVGLSPSIIHEMWELFVRELSQVAPELVKGDLDGMEQTLQGLGRRVLGRAAEEAIAAIAEDRGKEPPRCPHCHEPMRLVDEACPRSLQGLVGDYQLVRAYFYCDRCSKGCTPLDERLGIGPGSLSPGLARVACRLGIEKSFSEAPDVLGEALHMTAIDESVRRITEGIGEVAETEQQAAVGRARGGREPRGGVRAGGSSYWGVGGGSGRSHGAPGEGVARGEGGGGGSPGAEGREGPGHL